MRSRQSSKNKDLNPKDLFPYKTRNRRVDGPGFSAAIKDPGSFYEVLALPSVVCGSWWWIPRSSQVLFHSPFGMSAGTKQEADSVLGDSFCCCETCSCISFSQNCYTWPYLAAREEETFTIFALQSLQQKVARRKWL